MRACHGLSCSLPPTQIAEARDKTRATRAPIVSSARNNAVSLEDNVLCYSANYLSQRHSRSQLQGRDEECKYYRIWYQRVA